MRRMSTTHVIPGMVLGRPVYDSLGHPLLDSGTRLSDDNLKTLNVYRVGEVLIEDIRVADVPVEPLVAPELEAQAAQALRQLMTESRGSKRIEDSLLEDVADPIYTMTRGLYPGGVGEANLVGCPLEVTSIGV